MEVETQLRLEALENNSSLQLHGCQFQLKVANATGQPSKLGLASLITLWQNLHWQSVGTGQAQGLLCMCFTLSYKLAGLVFFLWSYSIFHIFQGIFHLAAKITLILVIGIHCMCSSAIRMSG